MTGGFVSGAGNGSALVHDAEIKMAGSILKTSTTLGEGVFGGAEETGR
jgi:hypothetical protein